MKITDLQTTVDIARSVLSAGAALYLTWKGRAKWEPSEVDVPRLPQKIVGLLSAVLLVWIALDGRWTRDFERLQASLLVLSGLCVAAALIYLFITATSVYYKMDGNRRTPIIGGFRLTKTAVSDLRRNRHKVTVQRYLLTTARSDPDRVWPRPSRAGMKVLFVACYITLSVAGTGALSYAALALANRHEAAVGRKSAPSTQPNRTNSQGAGGQAKPGEGSQPPTPPMDPGPRTGPSDAKPGPEKTTGPA